MRTVVLTAVIFITSLSGAALAQDAPRTQTGTAFPGSFWITTTTAGPLEPGNVVTQTNVEQGVVAWRKNSWFLVPFASVSMTRDTEGYAWNDKQPAALAIKIARRVPGGVVSAGGGVMLESAPEQARDYYPTAFVRYWAGWTGDSRTQVAAARLAYPGHASVDSGIVTGRDPHNWISALSVQQGVAIGRWRGIAPVVFAEAAGSVDTERRPWENRLEYQAGVKAVRNFVGSVLEVGVAQRQQHRFVADTSQSGPVAFVNLWVGWDPRRF